MRWRPSSHTWRSHGRWEGATTSPDRIGGFVRLRYDALRGRKHLTEAEIEKLVAAARKHNRHGARDALAITLAFRHGLRSQEVCDLEWTQVDLQRGTLLVNRIKGGTSSTHYLNGTEMRALRALRRENDKSRRSA